MRRLTVLLCVCGTLCAISGCSLEDAPLVGKPAATFDGHSISMSDYRVRLKVEEDLYKGTRTEAQKQAAAIQSLVDEQLIADEAARKGISVTDDEVNREIDFQRTTYNKNVALYRAQYPTRQAPPDFNQFLRSEGYDVGRLRDSVKHILLEQKLEHRQAQNRADAAYRSIQSGTPIADAARKYSDLPSASAGGQESVDSSHLSTTDARVQPAMNTLQPGDTSKVVEGSNGFYIIKLLTRDENGITAVFVFVSAPAPQLYTPKFRPQWFRDFIRGMEDSSHVQYHVGPKAS
ncbi:MAG: peptidylprolyl isomerase [Candidatus Dormibacteria bacterium]